VDGALLPAPPGRLRPRPRWGRYLAVGVASYCMWMGHVEWRAWVSLHRQEAALQRQAASLQAQDAVLRQQIAYESSAAYIEGRARQDFGLVSGGEVPLAPVGAQGSGTAAGQGSG
jgi:hypothetical protein